MKLVIQGKNIEITDAIRDYVEQKILKAVSHFKHLTNEVDVNLSVAKNPRISSKQSCRGHAVCRWSRRQSRRKQRKPLCQHRSCR